MWFYAKDEEKIGPLTEEQLLEQIENGVVTQNTLLWEEDSDDWVPAGESRFSTSFNSPIEVAPSSTVEPNMTKPPFMSLWRRIIVPTGFLILLSLIWTDTLGISEWYGDYFDRAQENARVAGRKLDVFSLLPLALVYIILPLICAIISIRSAIHMHLGLWGLIQDGRARTTPRKSVLFLFIPFFNMYWFFVSIYGLAKDMNTYSSERNIQATRVNPILALGICFLWIFTNLHAWYVSGLRGAEHDHVFAERQLGNEVVFQDPVGPFFEFAPSVAVLIGLLILSFQFSKAGDRISEWKSETALVF